MLSIEVVGEEEKEEEEEKDNIPSGRMWNVDAKEEQSLPKHYFAVATTKSAFTFGQFRCQPKLKMHKRSSVNFGQFWRCPFVGGG